MTQPEVVMIGLGYIGLPTAALIAPLVATGINTGVFTVPCIVCSVPILAFPLVFSHVNMDSLKKISKLVSHRITASFNCNILHNINL